MRDLTELKLIPRRRNPYGPPTKIQLRNFEKRFGVKLPSSYIEFLGHRNGGTSTGKLRFRVGNDVYGINDFFGLGPETKHSLESDDTWDFGNLWDETVVRSPVIGARSIPIARDGGGNLVFLDFRANPPRICYLNAATRRSTELFCDFDQFLESIYLK